MAVLIGGNSNRIHWVLQIAVGLLLVICSQCQPSVASENQVEKSSGATKNEIADTSLAPLDTAQYDRLLNRLSHDPVSGAWPVKGAYPLKGAILPFNRVVAYYGNLYSKRMGILGALPPAEMLDKLQLEVGKWEAADTLTPVIPALHYIVVTAQRDPGKGNKYRLRMPDKEIQKVLKLAEEIDALVFLDIQTGHSVLEEEIPLLKDYLLLPQVHLGIDPEYAMTGEYVPGDKVGNLDAEDINYASGYLADLVRDYHLPPKMLIVHRFKKTMVTNYRNIKTLPEVQIVVNMDGFGSRAKKLTTYQNTITAEPVQFAGFKLFYKNDIADPKWISIMQPEEILKLNPVPIYIQYQ